jgi:hypothetical protein
VSGLVTLLAGLFLLGAAQIVYGEVRGTGKLWSAAGNPFCVDAPPVSTTFAITEQLPGLREGVTSSVTGATICTTHPTTAQRLLTFSADLPVHLFHLVALLLVLFLISSAERNGVHTRHTAQRLRSIGWFIAIGGPIASLLSAVLTNLLLRSFVDYGPEVMRVGADWAFSWWVVLTGLGMVSFGRIMRSSADMREELEGTV